MGKKEKVMRSMLINQKKRGNVISVFFGIPRKAVEKKNFGDESSHSKKSGRTLQTATAEKWKSTSLAKYNTDDWLVNVKKSTNLVKSFNFSVSTKFIDRISSIKGFQIQWLKDSSKRLQHSAVLKHAESTSHKRSFWFVSKGELGLSARERTEKEHLLLESSRQQALVDGINVVNDKDFELTKKKFESMYFLAKNGAPLSLFAKYIHHEERHGVLFCTSYGNRTSGTVFLEFIAKSLRHIMKEKLTKRNFYSLLTDGSTDSWVIEKEAFFVLTFNSRPEGSDKICVEQNYYDLVEPETADANGTIKSITKSFNEVNINYLDKLVRFGSDGASVNRGG